MNKIIYIAPIIQKSLGASVAKKILQKIQEFPGVMETLSNSGESKQEACNLLTRFTMTVSGKSLSADDCTSASFLLPASSSICLRSSTSNCGVNHLYSILKLANIR